MLVTNNERLERVRAELHLIHLANFDVRCVLHDLIFNVIESIEKLSKPRFRRWKNLGERGFDRELCLYARGYAEEKSRCLLNQQVTHVRSRAILVLFGNHGVACASTGESAGVGGSS